MVNIWHILDYSYIVFCLAVSSFASNGFMQHMFSPIPHIAPAIEVYLVSDTSYYSTLYLHKGPLSSE